MPLSCWRPRLCPAEDGAETGILLWRVGDAEAAGDAAAAAPCPVASPRRALRPLLPLGDGEEESKVRLGGAAAATDDGDVAAAAAGLATGARAAAVTGAAAGAEAAATVTGPGAAT